MKSVLTDERIDLWLHQSVQVDEVEVLRRRHASDLVVRRSDQIDISARRNRERAAAVGLLRQQRADEDADAAAACLVAHVLQRADEAFDPEGGRDPVEIETVEIVDALL